MFEQITNSPKEGITHFKILEVLKQYPKEMVLSIIYQLIMSKTITFADITEIHIEHLEQLERAESEKLMKLRSEVIHVYTDHKKNMSENINNIIRNAYNEGWVNLSEKDLEKLKLND